MVLGKEILSHPLVTGAGGFIGFHLAKKLASLPEVEIVHCVDICENERIKVLLHDPKINFVQADLNRIELLKNLPEFVSSIFALAALNGTGRFYVSPFTVLQSSILPTLNILSFYKNSAPVLYSSSSEVYASTVSNFDAKIPTSEEVIPSIEDIHNPRWSYASAKLLGEVALNAACIEFGTMGSIVRYHNVYGSDMGFDHFIPDFIQRCQKGIFEITGGDESRAFLHVMDAVDGTIAALFKASQSLPIYHLGSNQEILIKEAALVILQELEISPDELRMLPRKAGSVKRRLADSTKALNELSWEAKIDFREGIKSLLQKSN
jgi:nucleoside-diphosphate-sugar epimerase